MTTLHEHVELLLRRQLDAPGGLPEKLNNALRILSKYRATLIQNTVARPCGLTIRTGPFRGMRFVAQSAEGCHVPKLLGCYEAELHPHILAAAGRGYDSVINIGAAEGYYAVGFARLMPDTRVHAYDANAASHPVCQALAERNGVAGPVSIGGAFRGEDFERFAGQNVSGAVGLAVINTVITTRMAVHATSLREQVTWARPGAVNLAARLSLVNPDSAQLMALKRVAATVQQQAMTLTYNDVFMLMEIAFFTALPMTFLLARPAAPGQSGGSAH